MASVTALYPGFKSWEKLRDFGPHYSPYKSFIIATMLVRYQIKISPGVDRLKQNESTKSKVLCQSQKLVISNLCTWYKKIVSKYTTTIIIITTHKSMLIQLYLKLFTLSQTAVKCFILYSHTNSAKK